MLQCCDRDKRSLLCLDNIYYEKLLFCFKGYCYRFAMMSLREILILARLCGGDDAKLLYECVNDANVVFRLEETKDISKDGLVINDVK